MPEFFDHAVANLISSEAAHGPRIILAPDNWQPGDAVIEHSGGCRKGRILKSYIHRIPRQKVTELVLGDISPRVRRSDRNASDNMIEVVTVQSSPQTLLFVDYQELSGRALGESSYGIGKRGVFSKELGWKRVQERRDGLPVQKRLGRGQATPKVA